MFCIAGDTNTRKGLFGKISQFIGSLRVEYLDDEGAKIEIHNPTVPEDDDKNDEEIISDNVWDSVLIIKKMANKPENIVEFSGVMSCAVDYGATEDFKQKQHIFGFTCTDWEGFNQQNIPHFKYLTTTQAKHEFSFITNITIQICPYFKFAFVSQHSQHSDVVFLQQTKQRI